MMQHKCIMLPIENESVRAELSCERGENIKICQRYDM